MSKKLMSVTMTSRAREDPWETALHGELSTLMVSITHTLIIFNMVAVDQSKLRVNKKINFWNAARHGHL